MHLMSSPKALIFGPGNDSLTFEDGSPLNRRNQSGLMLPATLLSECFSRPDPLGRKRIAFFVTWPLDTGTRLITLKIESLKLIISHIPCDFWYLYPTIEESCA